MAKKYLVGVGTVRAFEGNTLVFTGKTLLDTSLEVSNSNTEIRAGYGNALQAVYYHTSTLSLTITDAQFNLAMIAKNVGSNLALSGKIFKTESVTLSGTSGTITGTATAVEGTASVYVDYEGESFTFALTGSTFSTAGTSIPAGSTICVSYLTVDNTTKSLTIPANIVPSRLHIYVTVNLIGDVTGQGVIGTETIEIPVFQLSGQQTISMTADGVANQSLNGTAIATYDDSGSCDSDGYYAKITEKINNVDPLVSAEALAIVGGDYSTTVAEGTKTLQVYAIVSGQSYLVSNSSLTFTSSTASVASVGEHTGVITPLTTGTTTIKVVITSKTSIEANCNVEVTA